MGKKKLSETAQVACEASASLRRAYAGPNGMSLASIVLPRHENIAKRENKRLQNLKERIGKRQSSQRANVLSSVCFDEEEKEERRRRNGACSIFPLQMRVTHSQNIVSSPPLSIEQEDDTSVESSTILKRTRSNSSILMGSRANSLLFEEVMQEHEEKDTEEEHTRAETRIRERIRFERMRSAHKALVNGDDDNDPSTTSQRAVGNSPSLSQFAVSSPPPSSESFSGFGFGGGSLLFGCPSLNDTLDAVCNGSDEHLSRVVKGNSLTATTLSSSRNMIFTMNSQSSQPTANE